MVRAKIEDAFRRFMEKDAALLAAQANERSVTHRFAMYIEEQFPGYDVDCEYNRKGLDPKRLKTFKPRVDSANEKDATVYPDIVVHHRRRPDNFLVIEAKLSSNHEACADTANCACDLCKLRAYKSELGYTHAFYVLFPVGAMLTRFVESRLAECVVEIQ